MENHLIIGLGGTGGKILRAVRKRVFEEFGSNEPDCEVNLDYLYVDSDPNDLKNDAAWEYMGNPVHLRKSDKINIHGLAAGVLPNIDNYPGLRAFINNDDLQLMRDSQVQSIIDTGIGGQRRRFGRMLIANNIINATGNKFTEALKGKVLSMAQKSGVSDVTYHICAGLAGGTGSGTIIDTLVQISKINNGNAEKVFLYLYLPEKMVPAKDDAGFYQANGFAALMELNAMSINKYHPTDASGEREYSTGKVKRFTEGAGPYKLALVFTNENESNQLLEKGHKLPTAVADFIFQMLMGNGGMVNPGANKVFKGENWGSHPENNELIQPIHARTFGSFGIKRIIYPESEIREYATKKSVVSTLSGLISNKWINNRGFQYEPEEDAAMGIAAEARTPAMQKAMWLDYEHLTLQTPIEGYAPSIDWNTFGEYWSNICKFFEGDVLDSGTQRQQMISKFTDFTEPVFKTNFRDLGVTKFFAAMSTQRELNNYASVICRHIEWTIFKEWVNGKHGETTMSLQKARTYIKELEKVVRERMAKIPEQKTAIDTEIATINSELDKIQAEINDVGAIRNWAFGTVKRYFSDWVAAKKDYYTVATQKVAAEYAEKLMSEIASRLLTMANNLTLLQNMFNEAQAQSMAIANISFNMTDGDANSVQVVDKRFNPKTVEDTVDNTLIVNEELQQNIKSTILNAFNTIATQSTGESPFRSVYEAMGGANSANDDTPYRTLRDLIGPDKKGVKYSENTDDLIKYVSAQSTNAIMQKLNESSKDENGKKEDKNKILGINIFDCLKQEFPTEQMLEKYVAGLHDAAKIFLKFDGAETGTAPAGQEVPHISEIVQVVLPPYDKDNNYRNKFIEMLRGQFGNLIPKDGDEGIITGYKQNEIVLISLKTGFPLRFVENVKIMRNKYGELTSQHNPAGKLNKMLLHTESLNGDTMPSLFNDEKRMEKTIIAAFKLYTLPGIIEDAEDPDTGEALRVVNLGTRLEEENYNVGKNFRETIEIFSSNVQVAAKITKHVDAVFADTVHTTAEKQNYMKAAEDYLFDVILPLCGGNKLSPEFKEYKSAVSEFFKSLK